ncbi:unnamed protein product, partial [Rotaria sp. Silwood2]
MLNRHKSKANRIDLKVLLLL